MRKAFLTVASAVCLSAIAVAASPRANDSQAAPATAQDHPQPSGPKTQSPIQTFSGTIAKVGDQFILSSAKSAYRLDDQETASKFEGTKVKVTGTLDAVNLIIRVQSIEAAG
jgi:Protein of unknown function (DUF5818)